MSSSSDAINDLMRRTGYYRQRQLLDVDGEPPEIAGYELLDFLGKGGFGRVFRARHRALDCHVALKVTRLRGDETDLDEARALAKVRHPNVVHVNAVGAAGELGYVEMDEIDGLTLEAWIAMGQDPAAVLHVLAQIGKGLLACHRAGVTHRDVKPGNIMVDRHGVPVLVDFGLARREGPCGSPNWVAPEVVDGATPDRRSDQYSFGLVCQWALEHAGAPELGERFTARALAKDPGERWPTLAEGLGQLEPPPPPTRGGRKAVGILALVVALVAWAWLAWAWLLPEREDVLVVPGWVEPLTVMVEARDAAGRGEADVAADLVRHARGRLIDLRPELAAAATASVADQIERTAKTSREASVAAGVGLMAADAAARAGDRVSEERYRAEAAEILAAQGFTEEQIGVLAGIL